LTAESIVQYGNNDFHLTWNVLNNVLPCGYQTFKNAVD